MKRIIITGPTGAIGIAIIQKMIEEKIEVFAICNPESKKIARIPEDSLVHVVKCDLNHLKDLEKEKLPSCDVFYHLGWQGTIGKGRDDLYLQNQNVKNTLDAVAVAKQLGCQSFIGAGSQAEYGRVEGVLRPDTPVHPETGYGIAKLCAGEMARVACKQADMRFIWMRVLSVYGPYDGPNTLVMGMISKLLSGETPKTTKGEQLWDYLYSADAGKAFLLAGKYGKDQSVYCLGSGMAVPLAEYIEKIRRASDLKSMVDVGAIPYGEKQVMHLCADITTLKEDTGFEPEYTFEEGIRQTVEWYRRNDRKE